ncbi:hypothetical protein GQ54DRAFT_45343 [Martensiomyces pterosporus]|nr:hypothetical protein GQ54DRAFT_45343 [Martensiomyces pterosporus]
METTYSSENPADASSAKPAESAVYEDSRSETSTVDTDADEKIDLANLTFFTRLYEIPVVNDTVSSVRKIAESNRYTSSIISYAEKVGGFAEKSRPLLKPVEKPLTALDSYATRSLELIESKYPIVGKPTNEVIETVQTQAKAVESKYPIVARTFAVAKSTANSALDRVDYLVDYVLPPAAEQQTDSDESAEKSQPEHEPAASTNGAESPLGKVTILVHKVPQRLNKYYLNQLEASRSTIGGIRQSVKDTVTVYETEISERSQRLLGSVQERVKATVSTLPSYLPQFAQPYYEQGREILVTKAAKLHAEYSRTDEDARRKVLNLILISGEQVPVLEQITTRIFGKATASSEASEGTPAAPNATSTSS